MQDVLIDNKYRILRELGQGGNGAVYLAVNEQLQKQVALKIMSDPNADPVEIRRFQREAHALSSCNHPSIVKIHAFGLTADGRLYYVMDCLEGISLANEVKTNGPLTPARFAAVFDDILSALDHAHNAGLIHRDLKPSNIMLTTDGGTARAVLIDFGITRSLQRDVKLTATEAVIGTPYYMSPEQCSGGDVDVRADLYSLGCTMYEAALGHPPFEGETLEVLLAQMHQAPDSIPLELAPLLNGLLAKSPNDRFPSASDALRQLRAANLSDFAAFTSGQNGQSKHSAKAASSSGKSKRNKLPIIAGTVISIGLLATLAVAFKNTSANERLDQDFTPVSRSPDSDKNTVMTSAEWKQLSLGKMQKRRTDIESEPNPFLRKDLLIMLAEKEMGKSQWANTISDLRKVNSILHDNGRDNEALGTRMLIGQAGLLGQLPLSDWGPDVHRGIELGERYKDREATARLCLMLAQAGIERPDSQPDSQTIELIEKAERLERMVLDAGRVLKQIAYGEPEMMHARYFKERKRNKSAVPFAIASLRLAVAAPPDGQTMTSDQLLGLVQIIQRNPSRFDKALLKKAAERLSVSNPREPSNEALRRMLWCANLAAIQKDYVTAQMYLDRAAEIARLSGSNAEGAYVIHNVIGLIPMTVEEKIKLSQKALNMALADNQVDLGAVGTCYVVMGDAVAESGKYADAINLKLKAAETIEKHAGNYGNEVRPRLATQLTAFRALVSAGWIAHRTGDAKTEQEMFQRMETMLDGMRKLAPDASATADIDKHAAYLTDLRRGVEPQM